MADAARLACVVRASGILIAQLARTTRRRICEYLSPPTTAAIAPISLPPPKLPNVMLSVTAEIARRQQGKPNDGRDGLTPLTA